MREVRMTIPKGKSAEVARVAHALGTSQVTVYQTCVHGPDAPKEVVSVEASTPTAAAFVDALWASPFFDPKEYSTTSRSVRAILTTEDLAEMTKPFAQPAQELLQEFWQFSHLTRSLVGRTVVASALVAYGMLVHNTAILIAALLFTNSLPPLLAISFGMEGSHWRLVRRAVVSGVVGIGLAIFAGTIVAILSGEPLTYDEFGTPLANFLICLAVGAAAGLATADDVGERQLLGLAAAAQIAKFPVWVGISFVVGFPDLGTTCERLGMFGLNTTALIAALTATYALLGRMRLTRADRVAKRASRR
jgi:hypothetical protein